MNAFTTRIVMTPPSYTHWLHQMCQHHHHPSNSCQINCSF